MGVPKSLDYKDFMSKSTSANPTTWDDMYRFFGNQGEITAALVKSLLYQPGTAYSIGAIVYSPNLPAGTIAKCTVAGTTGSTEPVWPAVGSAVYDGTARWIVENIRAANIPAAPDLTAYMKKDADSDLSMNSHKLVFPTGTISYGLVGNQRPGFIIDASNSEGVNIKAPSVLVNESPIATKTDLNKCVKSINNLTPDSSGNVNISSSGGGGGSGDYLPLTGGTVNGGITATNFQTGTGAANYFQCRKFRGEGNANSYYHAIDFGYSGHDSVDFYEYDPNWNFYKCLTGTKSGAVLVGNINGNGWNGGAQLTGEPTAPTAPVGTNTTQIATTAFVQAAIPTNVSSFTNDAGYIKSVNNIKPDSNGNVNISTSSGGGGGVSTSVANTWTAQQNFQRLKFNFENFATSRISGTYDAPATSVATYNVTGALTLDMSTLTGMLENGESTLFTAYIASNASYALSITNAGTLKYAGRASDLAITASGLLLNIFLTKNASSVVTSIAQATKLS